MSTKKIQFELPAEIVAGAEQGILVGEFNNWNAEEGIWLEKSEDGSMRAELILTEGKTYEYRYLLSDGRWVNDLNPKTWPSAYGVTVENCIVEVPVTVSKTKSKNEVAKRVKKMVSKKEVSVTNKPDDLTKIEGIGKQIAAVLVKAEINTYALLAKSTTKKLKEILETAGTKFKMHNPGSWPRQAKLAAAGKWEELQLLQNTLKGGK